MADLLVDGSRETMRWLKSQGARFLPLYEWQFKLPDGRIRFSGGSAVECNGAGDGISAALFAACERAGIPVHYETRAQALVEDSTGVRGVRARRGRQDIAYAGKAIVLACGGFEADAAMRARYLDRKSTRLNSSH